MILITGATGFIGHYLLARLLRAGYACAVLVRPPQSESMGRLAGLLAGVGLDAAEFIRAERLVPLEGDLDDCWPLTRDATVSPLDASRPSRVKGWPSARELRVATIVHSAASTRFASGSDGEPERTNVRGTRRLLDWADAAGVRRFHLVSSAYVCGRSAGPVAERFEFDPAAFHNDYERAKWRAEQLCVEWAGQGRADDCQSQNPENGPAGRRSHTEGSRSHTGFGRGSRSLTIHRPSVVVGEFGSGRSVKFAGFYLMARATELLDRAFASACDADRQAVPLRIGARPADRQNIVPVDYVADCMAAIVGDPGRDGRVYH
ncbi:MAG: SDR family oxidoreductase, partial [Planctomycetes bacterium]|nr:SDR family oxidoreductase [Planctomycetota bacterium]